MSIEYREVRTQAELDKALADVTFDDLGQPKLIPVIESNGTFEIKEGSPVLHTRGSSSPSMVARESSSPSMEAWVRDRRYVRCPVALVDIVVHADASMPQKVKARCCAGPVAECDRDGKLIEVDQPESA